MENLEKLERLIGKFPARNYLFYCSELGWSKSKFYDYSGTLQNQNKIYNKNGLWYPEKLQEIKEPQIDNRKEDSISSIGSFQHRKWRNDKKELEKEKEVREIQAKGRAEMEIAELPVSEVNLDRLYEIRKKWRKRFGLEVE